MTRVWKTFAAALVVLLVAAPVLSGSWNEHGPGKPMKNYGVIWQGKLTRSGLPGADTGWDWLRAQGVKSIVTFLPSDEANVDYREHGFANVLRIPLSGEEAELPTERQAQRFLVFIQDPKYQPVHIHCAAGRDRTGMMAGLARYAVDGWPLDKALKEARAYRNGESLGDEYVAWLKDWASKHPAGGARLDRVQPPSIGETPARSTASASGSSGK